MGEMIKFGIKLAMVIATALAIVAALLILYQLISDALTGFAATSAIAEIFGVITIALPFNMGAVMAVITSLIAFKIAFWAADKMIELEAAIG